MKTPKVIWKPQEGSQELFLTCPVNEILFEGTRGGCGKTDTLLMKFAQYVGQGFGEAWKGVIFRQEYKDLDDLIKKSKKWFRQIFPKAKWLDSVTKIKWIFPDGEELLFRYGKTEEDYAKNWHGSEIPFIAFEELTGWADSIFYENMFTCNRSSHPDMPRFFVSTTNPYGIGHHWVKQRFVIPAPPCQIIKDDDGNERVRIHGSILENKILLKHDPSYIGKLRSIKNKPKRMAWLFGSWDIQAGGYFEEYWDEEYNMIDPFEIPSSWTISRSYDHGHSKPFSVGWWAKSDGSDVKLNDGSIMPTIKGDRFRIYEWYGCKRDNNGIGSNIGLRMNTADIANRIKELEEQRFGSFMISGVADSQIWTKENNISIYDYFKNAEVYFKKSVKGPNSRKTGWLMMGNMMENAKTRKGPGLFVFKGRCQDFERTVPGLMSDKNDLDDIDTTQEDHVADEVRYEITQKESYTLVKHNRI